MRTPVCHHHATPAAHNPTVAPAMAMALQTGRAKAWAWVGLGVTLLTAAVPAETPPAPAIPKAPAAAATAPSPIDSLNQAALQETFRLLRTNYIQREALTLEELNRAALEGLLARLDFGAELVPLDLSADPVPAPASAEAPAIISERLGETIAYLRPAVFTLESIAELDAALAALAVGPTVTLILDLRTPGPPAEFAVAAQWLQRFVPSGQPLFSVQKTDDPSPRHFRSEGPLRWVGKLLVLIDADCTNAGETIAAVLHQLLRAPLVGSPTRGRTMQYETAPIAPTHGLRFASAEMRLPDGTSLFRKGLKPTLTVPATPADKSAVFARQSRDGVTPFITNPERPRHNEAALVAGSAPELPYQLAQSAGTPTPFDTPPLQDRPLQVAVDVLTARRALE